VLVGGGAYGNLRRLIFHISTLPTFPSTAAPCHVVYTRIKCQPAYITLTPTEIDGLGVLGYTPRRGVKGVCWCT
jgi:hypothetical protein